MIESSPKVRENSREFPIFHIAWELPGNDHTLICGNSRELSRIEIGPFKFKTHQSSHSPQNLICIRNLERLREIDAYKGRLGVNGNFGHAQRS